MRERVIGATSPRSERSVKKGGTNWTKNPSANYTSIAVGVREGAVRAMAMHRATFNLKIMNMEDTGRSPFGQLAKKIAMPTRLECYETLDDIAKLAMAAYFAGSVDACGWFKNEPIKEEEQHELDFSTNS